MDEDTGWREYIHSDPEIMAGKPIFRNTRVTVEFVLELLADDLNVKAVLRELPRFDERMVLSAFAFVADVMASNPEATRRLVTASTAKD